MAKKTTTKKLTGAAATKATEVEPEVEQVEELKKGKPEFDITTALDAEGNKLALNDDGRLTAVPQNWTWDYAHLGRAAFVDRSTYVLFQARKVELQIQAQQLKLEGLIKYAEEVKTGGDPTAKKVKRAERLKAQLAALEAELEAEGITLDDE